MAKIDIKTSVAVKPMIYAYTTPEIKRHEGWTKIGYTERNVEERIKEQTHTADVEWNLEWKGTALYDDGSYEYFTDKDFHAYLRKKDYEQEAGKDNEWFHIDGQTSKNEFHDFKDNHGLIEEDSKAIIEYNLRKEQDDAVRCAVDYFNSHQHGEFLWNCKPRFGKTLATYDLCKRMGAEKVLIVTNRPAIANSWYDDFMKFGFNNDYYFATNTSSLKQKKYTVASDSKLLNGMNYIEFESLQDLKGSVYFGGQFDKYKKISETDWDLLVIDEAHEGVDTYKTDAMFERITRKHTLHLSGTPFKALANEKFESSAIFNWTYADEQRSKENWDKYSETDNPYETLPKLNMFTYQMSEIIREELKQGIEVNGEQAEYAFDLNEFFSVTDSGKFKYSSSVDKFLDALTTQEKFPFSTPELRNELKHTFWMLNRVESARQLARKLKEHPVFKDYEIVLAAGDGNIDDESESMKSFDKVVKAIKEHDKTITLSVGQLTTGVTIPEWTGVLMLSNMKSPALYMQAAFRSQNPCLFQNGTGFQRKENAYVFDFDPARTLTIFEEFANDLSPRTSAGKGDVETRKENIKELLNFFPVIGEDENGEMVELDAEKVLSIPRKIKSQEVVRRGFMSNFLFQNISNIFGASEAVKKIIEQFQPYKEEKKKLDIPNDLKEELSLNEDGEVELTDEYIVGKEQDVFGGKVYGEREEVAKDIEKIDIGNNTVKSNKDKIKDLLQEKAISAIVEQTKENYGEEMKASDKRQIESTLKNTANDIVEKTFNDYNISKNIIEQQRKEEMQSRDVSGKTTEQIEKEAEDKTKELTQKLQSELSTLITDFVEESQKKSVEIVETNKKNRVKKTVEDDVRDHLRGFTRTIPSFLMAYGDDTVTLSSFDTVIPDNVFIDVTSITLDEFRFLRDGGDYTEEETGETKHYDGNLFDPVVFDDSVKEFLALKKKLADYFDEKSVEDIFDYIPPQKTNQIFTPKQVVKKMVDMLEQENPGCFDDDEKTFIDLYMKSGLYITEIVKRLYQSEKMKELYPDKEERLKHIFEKQVYGLAPTEIIYRISMAYILGFDDEVPIEKHNFRLADATPYAKEGRLEELLNDLFGE